jgi:hypothetical protein
MRRCCVILVPEEGGALPTKSSGGKRGRSAVTGRFVRQSTVRKNPRTTVNEISKTSKKKK